MQDAQSCIRYLDPHNTLRVSVSSRTAVLFDTALQVQKQQANGMQTHSIVLIVKCVKCVFAMPRTNEILVECRARAGQPQATSNKHRKRTTDRTTV